MAVTFSVTKGKRLLPRQFGGVAVSMGAGVAREAARFAASGELVAQGQAEDGVHFAVRGADEGEVDAVVDYLEEAVVEAGLADERGGALIVIVASEEGLQVYEGLVELFNVCAVDQVTMWPDKLVWQVLLFLEYV